VPFYGQGANASFEDANILNRCLHESAGDWKKALDRYQRMRKRNVDALADLAIANFIEMRDHTGSRWFRLGKLAERTLGRLFPGLFRPLYSMVTFSNIPYADAVDRADLQWRVLRWIGILIGLTILALAARSV
ncbi:MAG: hypothetical protein KC983_04570, partial [Phycisphaerales bacterium]|nr:hypothetical protein [Phycisphaerales bacterium]